MTIVRVQHPHILSLVDSGSAGGFLFCVMPYIGGETLSAELDLERLRPRSRSRY